MQWVIPISIAAAITGLGGAALVLDGPPTSDCASSDEAVVPYDSGTVRDGRVLLHAENRGSPATFTVCIWEGESDGTLRVREVFSLGDGEKRTIDARLPAGRVAISEDTTGSWISGSMSSMTSIDLATCFQNTYERTTVSEATWYSTGSSDEVTTPVCSDPNGSGSMSASSGSSEFGLSDPSVPRPIPAPQSPPSGGVAMLVAGGGISIALLSWRFVPGLRMLGWLLFTRLRQPEILGQQTRNQVFEAIRQDPGIHSKAIADRLELGGGQVDYHLRVLVRSGLVSRVAMRGLRSFFVRGTYPPNQMRRMAAIRQGRGADVVALLRASPDITQRELARQLRLGESHTSKLVKRLREHGVVTAMPHGRALRLRLA